MGEIKPDAHNYRLHDEKNLQLIKKSLKECGFGRSIVADADGEIIAGNATYQMLKELGLPIRVIPTDGKTGIILQRTDLKTQDKARKKLAAIDNSASDLSTFNYPELLADFTKDELPEIGIDEIPVIEEEHTEVTEDEVPEVHEDVLAICKDLYEKYPFDGKIVVNNDTNEVTICWSNVSNEQVKEIAPCATSINPIGYWTGGTSVDTGITGRKLASDFYGIEYPLGGGTIHGKDLSKADCSVNIYCYIKAQIDGKEQKAICSIGDEFVNVNGKKVPFNDIVIIAREFIRQKGGFEKLAEWGLQ